VIHEWDCAVIGDSSFRTGGERKRTPTEDLNKASDELSIYDGKNDKWAQGANMPSTLQVHLLVAYNGLLCAIGTAYIEGKIYLFGGEGMAFSLFNNDEQ